MKKLGQTAIEYLYTYGWMFFGVSVIAGFFLSSSAPSYCSQSATGFSSQSLVLEDFGITRDGNLQVLLRNTDDDYLTNSIDRIRVTDQTTGETITVNMAENISPGAKTILTLENVTHVNDCRQLETEIVYDRGTVLNNQKFSGVLNARIGVENGYIQTEPDETVDFQVSLSAPSTVEQGEDYVVDYTVENTGNTEGTQDVEFYFDGSLEGMDAVTAGGGETVSGSFSKGTSGLEGEYPVRVETANDTASTSVEVTTDGGDEGGEGDAGAGSTEVYRLEANVSHPATVELYWNGTLNETRDVENSTVFERKAGNYSVNASAPDYQDASRKVELTSNTSVLLELEQYPPAIIEFSVTDNSQCNGFWCAFGGGNGPAQYTINWNVTDRYGELQEARILVNGVEEFTGKSGTGTFNDGGGWQGDYSFRLEANYTGENLCREVDDTADSSDPSGYTDC